MKHTTKKNFRMSEVLPQLVSKYRTVSPTELKEHILRDFNKDVSDSAVRMYIKRNPEVFEPLHKEMIGEDVKQVEVKDSLFQNGTFNSLNSIKKWNTEQATRISEQFQQAQVNAVKNVCQGIYYIQDKQAGTLQKRQVEGWTMKHPDRLTLEQAKEFLAAVHKSGRGTKGFRLALRAFFLSRDNITIKPTDISGEMGKLGMWADAVAPKESIHAMLDGMKEANHLFYVANKAAYYTAARCTAVLEEFTQANLVKIEGQEPYMKVLDKGFHRKGRQTWKKLLLPDLLEELEELFKTNPEPFAKIEPQDLRDFNKTFYKAALTGQALACALAEPMHFWRHQFAQHMLRACGWNFDLVAALGGWSGVDILKKCYGKPPEELIREAGLKAMPTL